jgi:NAD(P)-dependent dehydrogenase (short-subunit alcohol dehydrogenase family)
VFLAGNDAGAKAAVSSFVASLGLRPLDTGDLAFAHWLNRPLTGRTALVTGGTRGLGAAIVRALAARGAEVAFCYVRSAAAAESLSREIRAGGGAAEGFRADQADPAAAAGLAGRVLDRFGALDILVANASIDAFGRVDDPDRDEALFDRFWAVTRTGLMATVRAASRVISDDGRIVLIGSNQGTRAGMPGVADNAASKAAIDGYARGLARDLGPRRVTANVVHAGPMETDLIAPSMDKLGPLIERLCRRCA